MRPLGGEEEKSQDTVCKALSQVRVGSKHLETTDWEMAEQGSLPVDSEALSMIGLPLSTRGWRAERQKCAETV